MREVIDAARRASGVDIPVVETDRRPGDPVAVYGDNRRAADLLGWKPDSRPSTRSSRRRWRWHSTHPDGFDGLTRSAGAPLAVSVRTGRFAASQRPRRPGTHLER